MNLEHLGLMEPQNCDLKPPRTTSFMKPAPSPIEDETQLTDDQRVADPLAEETIKLWEDTAKGNRDIFTDLFRPVPTDLVGTKASYKVGSDPRYRVPLCVSDSGLCSRHTCCPTSRMGTLFLESP